MSATRYTPRLKLRLRHQIIDGTDVWTLRYRQLTLGSADIEVTRDPVRHGLWHLRVRLDHEPSTEGTYDTMKAALIVAEDIVGPHLAVVRARYLAAIGRVAPTASS